MPAYLTYLELGTSFGMEGVMLRSRIVPVWVCQVEGGAIPNQFFLVAVNRSLPFA
jgi:hypothetical protein